MNSRLRLLLALFLFFPSVPTHAEKPRSPIPPDAALVEVYSGEGLFEGPSWDPRRAALRFTQSSPGLQRILSLHSNRSVSVFAPESRGAAGTFYSPSKGLLVAESRRHRIVAYDAEGAARTLLDDPELNQPNDLVEGRSGAVYFTDPDFRERKKSAVYRLSPEGVKSKVIDDLPLPNGIELSRDQKVLYVADSFLKEWRSYSVQEDGTVGAGRTFFKPPALSDDPPDGMTIDDDGNLYLTGLGRLWVVGPDGKELASMSTPVFCSNVAFGGGSGRTLYLTCRGKVYGFEARIRE